MATAPCPITLPRSRSTTAGPLPLTFACCNSARTCRSNGCHPRNAPGCRMGGGRMSDSGMSLGPRDERLQRAALLVGAAGLALCACGVLVDEPYGRVQFFRSYLVAYLGVLSRPLGALAILMVYHL